MPSCASKQKSGGRCKYGSSLVTFDLVNSLCFANQNPFFNKNISLEINRDPFFTPFYTFFASFWSPFDIPFATLGQVLSLFYPVNARV